MDQIHDTNGSSEMLGFHIRKQTSRLSPRVGELLPRDRAAIPTPCPVAVTSRGVVPHVTPDLVRKHTSISVTYAGLEDFLEKSRQDAPIFHAPQELSALDSTFRAYTSLPEQCLSILGPRRVPSVSTPHQSTNSAVAISTSFGFASLELEDYNKATWKLKPDISTTLVDLVQADKISRKRIEKSADRTHGWLRDTVSEAEKLGINQVLFASIPPHEPEQQSFYLSDLANEFEYYLSGICVYEPSTTQCIPESLDGLPVLCLSNPQSPHDVLRAVSLGVDLITIPFVTALSEAGIALTFALTPKQGAKNEELGVDMWSSTNTTDLSSLATLCQCYACTRHHKAYVHHLLQAKEMLAWSLLQIHNFHVVSRFFQDIRNSISKGTFEEDCEAFRMAYGKEMPQQTGEGPRVRGYQTKSVGGGEPKKNPKAYNKFEEQARVLEEADSGVATPTPDEGAEELETHGLGKRSEQTI